jgi:hypothetical protein
MLTRMRAVNQPDVSPLRSQNGGARHKKSLSTSKFYCLAQPQAGDASVPGLKYCGARVPLSEPAVAVLEKMAKIRSGDFVFPLSNAAMLAVLDRMGHGDLTVHGFRSSFKDWATDWAPSPAEIVEAAKREDLVEAFARELVEMALAHTLDDKTEEAYRRTDMVEKRRRLMETWAKFCGKAPVKDNVINLPFTAIALPRWCRWAADEKGRRQPTG